MLRLNSYHDDYDLDGRGDDGGLDDDGHDGHDDVDDDNASCATLALRPCIITAGRRPTHAISFFFFIIVFLRRCRRHDHRRCRRHDHHEQ